MLDKAEPVADHILLELGFSVRRDGLARVTLRDAGREDRLSVIATARTFAA